MITKEDYLDKYKGIAKGLYHYDFYCPECGRDEPRTFDSLEEFINFIEPLLEETAKNHAKTIEKEKKDKAFRTGVAEYGRQYFEDKAKDREIDKLKKELDEERRQHKLTAEKIVAQNKKIDNLKDALQRANNEASYWKDTWRNLRGKLPKHYAGM